MPRGSILGVLAALLLADPSVAQPITRPAAPPPDRLAAPDRPGWTVDARNGCWLWNADPKPEEVSTWNGTCPGGPAEGEGEGECRYAEGAEARVSSFGGTLREGRLNGRGFTVTADGGRYDGEFRDDRRHGRGVETFADGDRYEGEYRNDRFHGRGIYSMAAGDRYEGEWQDDRRNGRGVTTFASGERYDGEWRDGRQEGYGTYSWSNGRRYEGGWVANRPDGRGTYVTPDDTVTGMWAGGCLIDRGAQAAIGRPAEECP